MIQFDEHIFQMGWNHQLNHQLGFLNVPQCTKGSSASSRTQDPKSCLIPMWLGRVIPRPYQQTFGAYP